MHKGKLGAAEFLSHSRKKSSAKAELLIFRLLMRLPQTRQCVTAKDALKLLIIYDLYPAGKKFLLLGVAL